MAEKIHRNSLKAGYHLHWYEVREILGQGGFGITYLAYDSNLDKTVAIKEYLPIELAVRERDSSVHPITEDRGKSYQWGLDRFIKEARTLAKFAHPNIVRVYSVFEENNTAYMVMEYEHGETLQAILSRRKTLEEAELLSILVPILGGLALVHQAGFIHRDIKPANIFIRTDGSPVLIDFGSARQALGEQTKTLTSLVSPGYAPFEQYYSKGENQGPWTDIYGLGATLYRAISGVAPMDAVDRSKALVEGSRDLFVPAVEIGKGKYSTRFLKAIDHALRFKPAERPQSLSAWKAEFGIKDEIAQIRHLETLEQQVTQPGTRVVPKPASRVRSFTVTLLIVVLLCLVVFYYRDSMKEIIKSYLPEKRVPETSEVPPPQQAISLADQQQAEEEAARIKLEEEIARLLALADEDFSAGRLINPPGVNALEHYINILKIDPDNSAARAGKDKIFQHFLQSADSSIKEQHFDEAERALQKADITEPDSREVKLARLRLDEARADANRIAMDEERKRQEEEQKRLEEEKELKAGEEARRLAEEQKRKAEEDAKRKAEEERLRAEEEARIRAEQEARIRADADAEARKKEEEDRIQREQQQREQFARYLQNGESAMNKQEYPEALLAYSQALEIFPDDATALSGQARARDFQDICKAIVGEWDWILGSTTIISTDGKLQNLALIPNHGTWECTDPSQRQFILHWVVGGWVDTVTLSSDGNTIDAINNIGMRFQGWRKGTRKEEPSAKNPVFGN